MYWARGCCTQTGVRTVPHPSRRSASTRSSVPLASEQTVGRLCNLLLPITDNDILGAYVATIHYLARSPCLHRYSLPRGTVRDQARRWPRRLRTARAAPTMPAARPFLHETTPAASRPPKSRASRRTRTSTSSSSCAISTRICPRVAPRGTCARLLSPRISNPS